MKWLERYFNLAGNKTNFRTELIAGTTTFMTMAYIVFVNPAILSAGAKMDFSSVMAATCLASAFATLVMAFVARYPIALAPGMGMNAFFAFTICGQMGVPWEVALGMVFVSGVIFTILTLVKIREMIVDAIPESIKLATAVGIGLFIAFIGLKDAGIVVANPVTFVTLGNMRSLPVLLSLFGLFLIAVLMARKVRGAILIGIVATGVLGIITGVVKFTGVVGLPSIKPTLFKLDIGGVFRLEYLAPIMVLLFFDMFDTIGTLVGVSQQAGLMKNGKLPRASQALFADATGTVAGACLGTSTVTSYIESSAGVAEGGRTGLASIVTGLLFLIALFFAPLAQMFGGGYKIAEGVFLYPVTAPALVIVGCLMLSNVAKISWKDYTEAVPAFLTIIVMPLTFSIAHGLAAGFISYPIIKLLSGRGKEASGLVYVLGAIFIAYYAFLLR